MFLIAFAGLLAAALVGLNALKLAAIGPQPLAQCEILSATPVYQSITRTALLDGPFVIFSTLESYHRNPDGDRFLLYRYDLQTGDLKSLIVDGSVEARSHAFSRYKQRYVLGCSLDPKVLLYDSSTHSSETVFSLPRGAWIHSIATRDQFAYTILSAQRPVPGFNGILRINLDTKEYEVLPFADTAVLGWAGVDSVDPTGRIWFYRGYPVKRYWWQPSTGMVERRIPGYEHWTVESWDIFGEHFFVILAGQSGKFLKKRVDRNTLAPLDDVAAPGYRQFVRLLPVDVYHHEAEETASAYYSPAASEFYRVDRENGTIASALGGIPNTQVVYTDSNEPPAKLLRVERDKFQILGVDAGGHLVLWLFGQKTCGTGDLSASTVAVTNLQAPNLSPADITALAADSDGRLYGGAYLTISDMFRFSLQDKAVELLSQAIPHSEGEITSLFTGRDGNIYGAGYPDSIIFRFNPGLPWNPGSGPRNNPANLGPMGHRGQMRAYKGVQDMDGNVWFESVTDYAYPIAHALARADFGSMALTVKTDLDDGMPIVEQLAVFDRTRLLLLGKSISGYEFYLLDQREFAIRGRKPVSDTGLLANAHGRILFAQNNILFEVREDLTTAPIHTSLGPILRILEGEGDDIFVLGRSHIERVDLRAGTAELWWNATEPAENVFADLSWLPAAFVKGAVAVGDQERLKLYRTRASHDAGPSGGWKRCTSGSW